MKIRSLPEIVVNRAQNIAVSSEFELVATLRYDPDLAALTRHIPIALQESYEQKFFLANLHYQRLKQGARAIGWTQAVENFDQEKVYQTLNAVGGDEPLAVRLALKSDGSLTVTTRPVPARKNLFIGILNGVPSIPVYQVYVNDSPVNADDLMPLKSNKRAVYDEIRRKHELLPDQYREALIYNDQGNIMEGTITSVAVLVDGQWICPKLENGGISSVMRSLLLDLKFITEGVVSKDDLTPGQEVILFNGVIGVVRGAIADASTSPDLDTNAK